MKVGDIFNLKISDIGYNGEGIGHFDGYTVFVSFALPNETVEARAEHIKGNTVYAKLLRVLESSSERAESACKGFTKCGGCDFLHLDYKAQLKYKRLSLINTLRKGVGFDIEVDEVTESPQFGCRNKLQMPFGTLNGKTRLGFFKEKTHEIAPVGQCLLHGDWAEKLIKTVEDYANEFRIEVYDERAGKGILRHLLARRIGDTMSVALVVNGESVKRIDALKDKLIEEFSDISLYLSVNKKRNNAVTGDRLIPIYKPVQTININGINAEINPHSFFQVNDYIRDLIYKTVADDIKNPEAAVIDAYSGVGLLGAIIAKRGNPVYNIEIVKEAVDDQKRLYAMNGLTAESILGDARVEMPKLLERIPEGVPLHIILDPPRKGADETLLYGLNEIKTPVTLHYISCNPATLSRDLKILSAAYKIEGAVRPFDMFPNTRHLECLVRLRSINFYA